MRSKEKTFQLVVFTGLSVLPLFPTTSETNIKPPFTDPFLIFFGVGSLYNIMYSKIFDFLLIFLHVR